MTNPMTEGVAQRHGHAINSSKASPSFLFVDWLQNHGMAEGSIASHCPPLFSEAAVELCIAVGHPPPGSSSRRAATGSVDQAGTTWTIWPSISMVADNEKWEQGSKIIKKVK